MTIIECINEKTALNLNPFQVFVFLNQKTKKFENMILTDCRILVFGSNHYRSEPNIILPKATW